MARRRRAYPKTGKTVEGCPYGWPSLMPKNDDVNAPAIAAAA
jgi:hypothetical protein